MRRLEPRRPLETTWEDWVLGGGAQAAFDDPSKPLEVEIGPGEDDFLLECARAQPERNWLGIEYSRKRIQRYVRRVEEVAGGLGNLRLIWRPAADLVGPFLSPEQVAAYRIHFPDPWPKAHHARYRLLTTEFLQALRQSLRPGGQLHVATDSEDYALEIVQGAQAAGGLESLLAPPGFERRMPGEQTTIFERRWRAEGRRIFALCFQKS